jgi:hypothetical protein
MVGVFACPVWQECARFNNTMTTLFIHNKMVHMEIMNAKQASEIEPNHSSAGVSRAMIGGDFVGPGGGEGIARSTGLFSPMALSRGSNL